MAGCDSAIARIDYVQKRYVALVGEMKKLEREHRAAKRKADLMQKERDTAKTELTKMTSVKDKLEKLSRETTNENRKLRVRWFYHAVPRTGLINLAGSSPTM